MGSIVVRDEPDFTALYTPEGAPLGFAPVGPIPHPWENREAWEGHGVLTLQRPSDPYAVMVFWEGPDRRFACWYVNFQSPLTRSRIGFDMLDHELDLWSEDGRSWHWKDDELLDERAAQGLFSAAEVERIRADGRRVFDELVRHGIWWDTGWAQWEPDPDWPMPTLPAGWERL